MCKVTNLLVLTRKNNNFDKSWKRSFETFETSQIFARAPQPFAFAVCHSRKSHLHHSANPLARASLPPVVCEAHILESVCLVSQSVLNPIPQSTTTTTATSTITRNNTTRPQTPTRNKQSWHRQHLCWELELELDLAVTTPGEAVAVVVVVVHHPRNLHVALATSCTLTWTTMQWAATMLRQTLMVRYAATNQRSHLCFRNHLNKQSRCHPCSLHPHTATAAGFDDAHGFDKGRIFFITPDDSQLRTAKPLPTGSAICSGIGITFAALSVIGIPYLVAKTVLIRKVATATSTIATTPWSPCSLTRLPLLSPPLHHDRTRLAWPSG